MITLPADGYINLESLQSHELGVLAWVSRSKFAKQAVMTMRVPYVNIPMHFSNIDGSKHILWVH